MATFRSDRRRRVLLPTLPTEVTWFEELLNEPLAKRAKSNAELSPILAALCEGDAVQKLLLTEIVDSLRTPAAILHDHIKHDD